MMMNILDLTRYCIITTKSLKLHYNQTLRWLATVDDSGLKDFPIIANSYKTNTPLLSGIWDVENCEEIHTGGWYQPVMLNHKALERMREASRSYGLTSVCKAYDVSQDVGNKTIKYITLLLKIHKFNNNNKDLVHIHGC